MPGDETRDLEYLDRIIGERRKKAEEMRARCPSLRQVFVAGTPLPGQHSLAALMDGPAAAEALPRLDPSEFRSAATDSVYYRTYDQ